MTIPELEHLMDRFQDAEDVDARMFEALRSFFVSDPEDFKAYVNRQQMGASSYRPILYESLSEHANGWEDFMIEQTKHIVEASHVGDKGAEQELYSVYYLTSISGLEDRFYDSLIEYFNSKLDSNNISVRKHALEYIIDLHSAGDKAPTTKQKKLLRGQLMDPVFNVRMWAYIRLQDGELLLRDYKQPLIDRIRTKVSSDYLRHKKEKQIGETVAQQVINSGL